MPARWQGRTPEPLKKTTYIDTSTIYPCVPISWLIIVCLFRV